MYFQQIFWCVYDKGSDLAGGRPFLKRKIICRPEHWPKQLSHRKEGKKGAKEKQKKEATAGERSQGGNGIAFVQT